MSTKKNMRIEKKHYDAFNYWFGCTQEGDNITTALERTAKEFNVEFRTVRYWYDGMGWKEMSQKRMQQIQREVERRDNRTFAKNQKKYLDIMHRLLYEYVEDGLPAKIESIRDLDLVITNSLRLQDAPTEHVKQETEHSGSVEVATPLFDRSKMEEILEKELESEKNNNSED